MSVLITGAETAVAVMVLQSLSEAAFAGSFDPLAPGFFLVPENRRLRLPSPDAPTYVTNLLQICWQQRIQVLIPCGDTAELLKIAHQRQQFERMGVQVVLAPAESLACSRDQLSLRLACQGIVPLPESSLLNFRFQPEKGPWIIKPRFGRGLRLIKHLSKLKNLPHDESFLVQEFLSGDNFHVDTLLNPSGVPLTAVVRIPLRMEQGVLVSSRSIFSENLQEMALKVAHQLGLSGAASIHFRKDDKGALKMTKVIPHFQPSMTFSTAAGLNLPALCLQMARKKEAKIPEIREVVAGRFGEARVMEANEEARRMAA